MENNEMSIAQAFVKSIEMNKCNCIQILFNVDKSLIVNVENILNYASKLPKDHKCIGKKSDRKVPRNYLVCNTAEELEESSKKLANNEGLAGHMIVPYKLWEEIEPVNRTFFMIAYDDSKIQINDM